MSSRREQVLETLHGAAMAIQACRTVDAAYERTVEAAEDILEFELCAILAHDNGWLDPVALSTGAPADGARPMASDQGMAGKTFQTGRSFLVEDVEADATSDPAKESYRSAISVPVGETGVFQAVSPERAAFDEEDIELAELLVAHTARTIDRIEFERELQVQQEALQRQNERLDQFVGVVSHDLRSPLSVAGGQLELARAECDSERLDAVARAHERMGSLIDNLLTVARGGSPIETLEAVDLAALVRTCWQTVDQGDATLEIDTGRTIRADRNRLQQLLENLLRNAADHGGEGVTVTVGDLDGSGFYVADDGRGFAQGRREDVFDWGYSTEPAGTGFGLAIVREIVEAHDWEITAADSETGGARFDITGVERITDSTAQP